MFGKPDWFGTQEGRQRICATTWKGRLYRAAWIAAIALPALLLLSVGKGPEAVVWLAASGGLFAWDWRQIKRNVGQPPSDNVMYIGDDDGPNASVATANYQFFRRN